MAPILFGRTINGYALHPGGQSEAKRVRGVLRLLALALAVRSRLARAIFDRATAALDPLTEEHSTTPVRQLLQHSTRTTLLLAHYLATALHAQTISVPERGGAVALGAATPSCWRAAVCTAPCGIRRSASAPPRLLYRLAGLQLRRRAWMIDTVPMRAALSFFLFSTAPGPEGDRP